MVLAIPGGRGMFSFLQAAIRETTDNRVRLSRAVHDQLDDFRYLAESMKTRPMRLAEVVHDEPLFLGTCDAAGAGMGGVWLPLNDPDDRLKATHPPMLWRERFPAHIQRRLVSWKNPSGDITNSDLELAGTIGHQDVLAHEVNIAEANTATGTDNTPALYWQTKGSTTTTKAAGYLLRLSALHQRHHRYLSSFFHIPGVRNCMADDCSRLWHLTDTELLVYFNAKYPQSEPWQMRHLNSRMNSALIASLQCKRQPPQETFHEPEAAPICGKSGASSASPSTSMTSLPKHKTQSHSCKCLPDATAMAASSDTATEDGCITTASALAQLKTPFARSKKRLLSWGP
jgi:hypothetical protein